MFKWIKNLFRIKDYQLSPEDYEKWKKEVAYPSANEENEVYLQEMSSTALLQKRIVCQTIVYIFKKLG